MAGAEALIPHQLSGGAVQRWHFNVLFVFALVVVAVVAGAVMFLGIEIPPELYGFLAPIVTIVATRLKAGGGDKPSTGGDGDG